MLNPFATPLLTRRRIVTAAVLAVLADGLQVALGPLGWVFIDQIIDVAAMLAMSLLLGFHPLFLPTFVIELIPVADMMPTWTACVATVILLRKRGQNSPPPVPARPAPPDVIDV